MGCKVLRLPFRSPCISYYWYIALISAGDSSYECYADLKIVAVRMYESIIDDWLVRLTIGLEFSPASFGINETPLEMLMLVGGPSSRKVRRSAFNGLRLNLLKVRLGRERGGYSVF